MNRLLVALGAALVVAGLLWPWLESMHLFRRLTSGARRSSGVEGRNRPNGAPASLIALPGKYSLRSKYCI
jgi:hypothetical protein